MKSRKDLPKMLTEMGLTGSGVEVGVAQGNFSRHILKYWTGNLFMVDPYHYGGDPLDKSDTMEQHLDNLMCSRQLEREFPSRCRLIRDFSTEAAQIFHDNSLDFVYIDAKHDYRSVWADLEAWYPKVRIGGVLAGHDYKNSFVRKNLVEVKRAVDRFVWNRPEQLMVTEEDNLPSWYFVKL